jgi:hypothetical protein
MLRAASRRSPLPGISLLTAVLAALPAIAAPLIIAPLPDHGSPLKRELTPADAISTVRVMQNQLAPSDTINNSMTSPDGSRYVIRLAYGDITRDGVWVDLLTGSLGSLAAASHPRRCAHLFTTGLGSLSEQGADLDPSPNNQLRWLNNTQVALLWSDPRHIRQVMTIDLATCRTNFLTHHPTHVLSFGVGAHATLLFDAKVPPSPSVSPQRWAHGFTISDTSDGWSILAGDVGGETILDRSFNNEWFIQTAPDAVHRVSIAGNPRDPTNPSLREIAIDPKGRFALTPAGMQSAPAAWNDYPEPFLQTLLESNRTNASRTPLRYLVIDLAQGTSHSLWNAPKGFRSQVAWCPVGNTVLLAPTFFPLASNPPQTPPNSVDAPTSTSDAGLIGAGAAEINVVSGEYTVLPVDLQSRAVVDMSWTSATSIEIQSTNLSGEDLRTERFKRNDDEWARSESIRLPNELREDSEVAPQKSIIRIETRQDLNHPPQIFAVDSAHGKSELILDPNPTLLARFKLGRVERISGTLPNGRQWLGQLIYPADYAAGTKYPLLIQSMYGRAWGKEEFALDGSWASSGMGLGPSLFASYPGQLLATRNVAVLQLEVLHPSQGVNQAQDYQLAFETVAQQLSSDGLIDQSKIALAGFSRNGYWVEYTLAHSKFPFAAAIAADNYDPSYFQSALADWRPEDVQANGAAAFGAGLQEWLARAPGFNAEYIHTPLRMIGQSAGIPVIIAKWEIYSRLRYLRKPVEMYMMPDSDKYPSHTPQNPRQITAIQEGSIDWFSFWLTGREDSNPLKQEQYTRWHALRSLQSLPNP